MDVAGHLMPKSLADYAYILVATEYFSKQAEAVLFRESQKENLYLICTLFYRFGVLILLQLLDRYILCKFWFQATKCQCTTLLLMALLKPLLKCFLYYSRR